MSDEIADPVQPEGQGGQAPGGDSPYADYLNRIPEEFRGQVEPVFRDWDSNVTRKFQEASEFRQQFEPYQPLGLTELSPDEVAWALQFRQAAVQNPDAVRQWYEEYAQQHGLTPAQAAQQAPAPPAEDPYGGFQDPTVEALKQQLTPLQEQLEQLNSWRQQQERAAREADAQRFITSQLEELKAKHPDEFNEPIIARLAREYEDSDPQHAVPRAFADYQAMRAQIEMATLQSKANQPPPAESGGLANATPEEPRTFAEARAMAEEHLRQARSA